MKLVFSLEVRVRVVDLNVFEPTWSARLKFRAAPCLNGPSPPIFGADPAVNVPLNVPGLSPESSLVQGFQGQGDGSSPSPDTKLPAQVGVAMATASHLGSGMSRPEPAAAGPSTGALPAPDPAAPASPASLQGPLSYSAMAQCGSGRPPEDHTGNDDGFLPARKKHGRLRVA